MSDDTVATKIINEQLQFSLKDAGFSYASNLHINETAYNASGPSHFVEQGSFTESWEHFGSSSSSGLSIVGKFTITENQNHVTSIADYSYSSGGHTFEDKSNYTSNGNGYNLVEQHYMDGDPVGVFHYHG